MNIDRVITMNEQDLKNVLRVYTHFEVFTKSKITFAIENNERLTKNKKGAKNKNSYI